MSERWTLERYRKEMGLEEPVKVEPPKPIAPTGPVRLTLPLPPSSNRYWRTVAYISKKTRKPVASTYVSDEATKYKQDVSKLYSGGTPIVSAIKIEIKVYRARRSGDLDNKIKVLLDAMQGIAYIDDNQITEMHAYRFEDKGNPRVEVEITPLGLL
jgi:crossover junction endodeoxyribonuclease RusA